MVSNAKQMGTDSRAVSIDYLMSLFAVQQTQWVAQAVVQHLEERVSHSGDHSAYYQRLLPIWKNIIDHLDQQEQSAQHGWSLSLSSFYKQQLKSKKIAISGAAA